MASAQNIVFGDGTRGHLAVPESSSGPGLILLQEWWGLVPHIKDVALRFADAGFVTLAPDLYAGETTDNPDEAGRRMLDLRIPVASAQLQDAAQYLLRHEAVTSQQIGALGFCMGGQLALFAACEHPGEFGAVVDFYGIHPKVELDLAQLQAPVLAHFGESDAFVPKAQAESLIERLNESGTSVEAHFYRAGHAFFNDSRPEAYDRASANLAWDRSLAFLRKHLAK